MDSEIGDDLPKRCPEIVPILEGTISMGLMGDRTMIFQVQSLGAGTYIFQVLSLRHICMVLHFFKYNL